MDKRPLKEYYKENVDEYFEVQKNEMVLTRYTKGDMESLIDKIDLLSRLIKIKGTFLDIGGGDGWTCEYIVKNFLDTEVINYDLNPEKQKYSTVARNICGDCHNLQLEDNSVDIVFNSHTFEHILDQKRFVEECMRVLKHGGYLYTVVPIDAEDDDNISHISPFYSRDEYMNVIKDVINNEQILFCEVIQNRLSYRKILEIVSLIQKKA